VLTLMARSEVPSPFFQQAPAQFIGAAASPVRANGCQGGRGVKNLVQRARQGGCEWIRGQSRVWTAANAEAPCGGPVFKGGLGARDIFGRRGSSIGARPKRRGKRGAASAGPTLCHCTPV
jgi:hypothetical protein